MDNPLKCCNKCGKIKPLSEFHRTTQGKDGRMNTYRICRSKRIKELYDTKRQQISDMKIRAKYTDTPFDFKRDDIDYCLNYWGHK